jgi:hypothetical protein
MLALRLGREYGAMCSFLLLALDPGLQKTLPFCSFLVQNASTTRLDQ